MHCQHGPCLVLFLLLSLSAFSQLPETMMFACILAWYLDFSLVPSRHLSELAQEAWSLDSVWSSPYLAS